MKKRSALQKFFIFLFILLIILVIFFFGAKILVYARFFLGNDILVKLNADKQNLYLKNGDQETITFSSSVTTNPFCKNTCDSKLVSISDGTILYSENFSLGLSIPIKKEYTFIADGNGKGLDLYRFDLNCRNIYSDFCHTEEEPVLRSILITVSRDLNNNENEEKVNAKLEISNRIKYINKISNEINYLKLNLNDMSRFANLDSLKKSLSYSEKELSINLNIINNSKTFWENQSFADLNNVLKDSKVNFSNLEQNFNQTKLNLESNITIYNELAQNLTELSLILHNLENQSQYIFNESLTSDIDSLVDEFNTLVANNTNTSLDKKYSEILIINNKLAVILPNAVEEINAKIPSNKSWDISKVYIVNMSTINNSLSNITIINDFDEPYGICCISGNCTACCDSKECSENKDNYPIIFIHGHDFSKAASADYSFESFRSIQQELENNNYINAGTISLYSDPNEPIGVLSQIPRPLSFRVSYYFDYFKDPLNPIIIQTKTENIDTYAIRLKDIIEEVKIKTNRPKVNIISHSMGGLAVRRYIQLFGSENVDKVILITSPNKGIEGDVSRYCAIFGEKLECEDMNSNSLFMNKLSREGFPAIKIYNIVGVGCNIKGEDSDGIVLKRNAVLEGENIVNIYINGTCTGIDLLHTEILKTKKYRETYKKIIEILEDEE
ncbi:MAG TPA: alpha/beta hydrolase [Candidatus Nanoarchaeia archaeon]|nr:alpha/beta hydrolase [Candidatus Nanoarchaeia archaeon]